MIKRLLSAVRGKREKRHVANFDLSPYFLEQENLFGRAGLDFKRALAVTAEFFATQTRTDSSMHYEVVAALVVQKSIRKILEIGTQTGRFTRFIAELSGDLSITTVDLPDLDERFDLATNRTSGKSGFHERVSTSRDVRQKNLEGLKNITFLEMNSVELTNYVETYDLVFVDGDHTYPTVVIDAMNAIRMVGATGWILFDDLRPRGGAISDFGGAETTILLDELESSGILEVFRFHKRLEARRLWDAQNAKMIALARRKSL